MTDYCLMVRKKYNDYFIAFPLGSAKNKTVVHISLVLGIQQSL